MYKNDLLVAIKIKNKITHCKLCIMGYAYATFILQGLEPVLTESDWLSTLEGSDKILYYPSVNVWIGSPVSFLVREYLFSDKLFLAFQG